MCEKVKKTDITKQQEYDPEIILLFASDVDIDACVAIMPPLPGYKVTSPKKRYEHLF